MSYVIKRDDDFFVAPAGMHKSYTRYLQKARRFRTKEAAEADCCEEGETVLSLEDAMETSLE